MLGNSFAQSTRFIPSANASFDCWPRRISHSFKGWASFDGNSADTGAAFAIQDGTLTFQQPDKTRFTNGSVFNGDYPVGGPLSQA